MTANPNSGHDSNHVPTLSALSSVDGFTVVPVYADPTTHALLTTSAASGGTVTSVSVVTANGVSGSVATATTTPAITLTLGAITPTTVNGNTITTSTGVLTLGASKTLTVSNTLTLSGTDSTVMTFPTTSATIARTDAANTFTGIQTFSTPIATGSVATMTATVGGGVPTPPNNTTTFLRGDGTFAAPAASGGTPTLKLASCFETAGRFSASGSGTATFGINGLNLTTTATTTRDKTVIYSVVNNGCRPFLYSPQFAAVVSVNAEPTTGSSYFGVGSVTSSGTGHDYLPSHFGFKIIYAASTPTLSATNSESTTETATTIVATVTGVMNLYAVMTATTNIKYYVNTVLGATHTTNLPPTNVNGGAVFSQFSVSNNSTATTFEVYVDRFSYEQNVA